jgi:hypothetical protein
MITRLLVGILTPAIRATYFSMLHRGLRPSEDHPYLNAHFILVSARRRRAAGEEAQTAKSPVGTRKGDACRTWFEHVE